MPDDPQVGPGETIEALRRELAARTVERDEAVAERAAIAEVLQVINASPGDLVPVFDAILKKATRVCEAAFGVLLTWDGERFHWVAFHGLPAELVDALQQPVTPVPGNIADRIVRGERVIATPDLREAEYRGGPFAQAFLRHGARSCVHVALHKEERLLGLITVYREEIRPFTEKQTALLESFAAQAVIAMENARLITETREALEQQTATAEVLQVINSSPGDLAPVLEVILEKAHRLCGVHRGSLQLFDGDRFRAVATRFPPDAEAFAERLRRGYPASDTPVLQPLRGGVRFVHVPDLAEVDDPMSTAAVAAGTRSILYVPLRRDDAFLGMIVAAREHVRPFSKREIALLENFAAQAVIAMENARLLTETREALEQQTATAEVLGVINSSPGDLTPVFEAMLDKAMRLCEAAFGVLWTYDGTHVHAVAHRGASPSYAEVLCEGPHPADSSGATQRFLNGERFAHGDPAQGAGYRSGKKLSRALVDLGGGRSYLAVPLRKDDALLGYIVVYWREVRSFVDKQIALMENFAAQAVIAMENARLITETREALEQQTATAEVLQVINSSPGDLAPVFDSMLEKALTLCEAVCGQLATLDGDTFEFVAATGDARWLEQRPRGRLPASRGLTWPRIVAGEPYVHILDAWDTEAYRSGQEGARDTIIARGRTYLTVALLREQALLGALTVYRQEVRPFSDKEIALLQNFAAQAVISMENARLITETREALEQQTATAEILEVINRSPGDLAPVFDAILDKAMQLCGAAFGLMRVAADEQIRTVAARGVPAGFAEFTRRNPVPLTHGGIGTRIFSGEAFVHALDLKDDELYRNGDSQRHALVDLGGALTSLAVALRREEEALGAIQIYRQEVRPFTDKQIALLQNFAAQAVIAMENARLLTETREALEQQTATAEVLQVINSSPGDLAPVFDAILDKGSKLCDAAFGTLRTYDGERFHLAASRGASAELLEFQREPLTPGPGGFRLLSGEALIHVPDIIEGAAYQAGAPAQRALVALGGARSYLSVALRKEKALLGYMSFYRREVRPFTDKQIALLENFAAQAVIAMENARLLTETREALEQQTATAEVLQVINSSPGDLTPVFDAMLEKAMHLCEAAFGMLWTYEGEHYHAAAVQGAPRAFVEFIRQPQLPPYHPESGLGRMLQGQDLAMHEDMSAEEAYRTGDPLRRAIVDLGGARSAVTVSLRKEETLLGAFTVYRQEVRPFTDKQIALLQNFAAQAVIAMDNARLLDELQHRTRDLQESLEYQTATSDVLKVISRSTFDLDAALRTVVTAAAKLCRADHAGVYRNEGGEYRWAAGYNQSPEYEQVERAVRILPGPGTLVGRTADHCGPVQILDAEADPLYEAKEDARIGNIHSMLGVPLLREGSPIGVIGLARTRIEPFAEKQVELVSIFADQSVIAIENARLLNELRDRTDDLEESLEYQTATSDVLKVISRSTFDLQPVLDTLLETAARLCAADLGNLSTREAEGYRVAATFSTSPEFIAAIQGRLLPVGRGSVAGRAASLGQVVRIADLAADPEFAVVETVKVAKMRTAIGVPLLREGVVVGVLSLARGRVEPFTERQIELVRTFADQAVIAIENTRLITETREALEQQTATAEVLQVINSSPGDLAPVYDVILEKARSLCDVPIGGLMLYDGEHARTVALHGFPEQFIEEARRPFPPTPPLERLIRGERLLHEPDYRAIASQPGRHPAARALVEMGVRTTLVVPLRKDGKLLGCIAANRLEVRPFSDKEIALLESFAAQAVIAMDNARLLDEIRQRQAELRVTFDNMGDGVAMFDSDQRLAAWNLNFQRILDLPDALLVERPSYADFVRILAERGEFGADGIEAELSRRLEATDQELRLERIRPDGRVIEVRRNAVPGGGFVLIYSDITERKRAEAEIRTARDTAERALQELQTAQASLLHAQKMAALGQLTAGIAHEIKNPLNFVNNFAELSGELLLELKETTAPAVAALGDDERAAVDEVVEMLRGNLDKIAEHGKRADGIVKSMLEHSRGVSGERREVDLNALIEEALNLAYHGARAQDASFNITLEREFDRGLAPTELAPQEMTRVFLNLFGNGFYATAKRRRDGSGPDFRPTLRVATRDLGDAVEVRVRDNGTGIAPEIRDKLFQPFVTTKPTGEGTGLGLSISYDIITQQHGGTIEVDSRQGEFTEFTIRLPRARYG